MVTGKPVTSPAGGPVAERISVKAPAKTAADAPAKESATIDAASLTEFCTFHEGYVSKNIQLADAKAGLSLIAFSSVMALALKEDGYRGAIKGSLGAIWPSGASGWSWMNTIAWLALLLCSVGTVLAFWVIAPRLDSGAKLPGMTYWGDVARHENAGSYAKRIREATAPHLLEDRLEHLFQLSRICSQKMRLLTKAMWLGAAGVALTTLWIIVFSQHLGD